MFAKLDFAILRLVMKIAHYIDYRWHVNNYYVASYIIRLCQFCAVGLMVVMKLDGVGTIPITVIGVISAAAVYAMDMEAKRFRIAGWKWERSPGTIPTEVYREIICPSGLRLVGIFLGTILVLTNGIMGFISKPWEVALLGFICWPWNAYSSIATYFVCIPPSSRKRKEKKARAWSFGLMPSPVGGRT